MILKIIIIIFIIIAIFMYLVILGASKCKSDLERAIDDEEEAKWVSTLSKKDK